MRVKESIMLSYVAVDGITFADAKQCKEYEEYLNAKKVYFVEVLGKAMKGVLGAYPHVLYVCATMEIAEAKVKKLNASLYQYVNIIEKLVEG